MSSALLRLVALCCYVFPMTFVLLAEHVVRGGRARLCFEDWFSPIEWYLGLMP